MLFTGTALIQSVSYFEYLNSKQRFRRIFCYSDICEVRNWSFDSADHPSFSLLVCICVGALSAYFCEVNFDKLGATILRPCEPISVL